MRATTNAAAWEKGKASRIIVEDSAVGKSSGSPASHTLRTLGRISQLVVRQSRIGRFKAGVPFGLQATGDIDKGNQTDLAHSLYSHDHMPRPSAIFDAESSVMCAVVGVGRDAGDLGASSPFV